MRGDIAEVGSCHLRLMTLGGSGGALFVVTESEFVHTQDKGEPFAEFASVLEIATSPSLFQRA